MVTDDDGRHARPEDPDEVGAWDDGLDTPDSAAGRSTTQPLPMVRREGLAAPDPQPVRAVAKRVPSALPALGRDEITDVPPSARANADRRRRAREEAAGGAVSGDSDQESDPAPYPPAGHVPRQRQEPEIERLPVAVAAAGQIGGEVELVPIGSRARVTPVASADAPPPAEPPTPTPPSPGASGLHGAPAGHETPYARGGRAAPPPPPPPPPPPAPPLMGQPPEEPDEPGGTPDADRVPAKPGEILEAEIIDDRPRPYVAGDLQTDEWATVPVPPPSAPSGQPPAVSPHPMPGPPRPGPGSPGPGPHPPAGSPRPSGPPPRHLGPPAPRPGRPGPAHPPPPAGPLVRSDDRWETTPLPPVTDEYEGRRRRVRLRGTASRPSRAGWLVVLGVVLSLSAAVAVPFIITGNAPDLLGSGDNESRGPTPALSPSYGASLPYITAAATTPPASPSATPPAPTPTPTPSPTPPPLVVVPLEAENASLSGCAQSREFSGASGGRIVDRLGEANDWTGCSGHGIVTFNNVSLPAGTFTITVHYVFGINASQDPSRYARLRVNPDGTGATIDYPNTYPRTTTCCQTWTTAPFTASAGTFDISFTHPGLPNSTDRAPALDRIVIQQTS